MRILVVSQYFWPENFRINDLVSEWGRRGHQVTVLTGVPNYPDGRVFDTYSANPDAYAQYEGARVVRVPILPRGQGRFRLALNYLSFVIAGIVWGALRLRTFGADVVFVFEPSPVTVGLPALWMGKLKNAPVVFWALDLWPETLSAVGVVRSRWLLSWVGYLVRFIYNRCTLVLGQSRSFLGSIAKYCNDPEKIRYFPSWAEDVFVERAVDRAPEVPVRDHGFTVLFAGNIGEAQGMPAVLDAAEYLKKNPVIRWVIVGDGRMKPWLESEISRRGLQEQVLVPGRFPLERMPSFYAHADALLVSLKRDPVFSMTIPGKVQSYLMAGIPVLGMLDGEGAAVINDAKAGFTCDAEDSMGLVRAVLQMASTTPEERRQMGERGRWYVAREFGRASLMERMEVLLNNAVASYRTER